MLQGHIVNKRVFFLAVEIRCHTELNFICHVSSLNYPKGNLSDIYIYIYIYYEEFWVLMSGSESDYCEVFCLRLDADAA